MTIRSRLQKIGNAIGKSLINQTPQGGIPVSWPSNWFQLGMTPVSSSSSSVVEACISAYAQTIAQCPCTHYRMLEDGSQEAVRTSNVQRVLNKPNYFQSRSDFLLNLVHSTLREGNGYILSLEDPARTEEMYLLHPRNTRAAQESTTGEIFYQTAGEWLDMASPTGQTIIPARFVGHLRMHTPYDPLIGVTPIAAAAAAVAANNAIINHTSAFHQNMSRPSGVLSTEMKLSKEQMTMLREAWEDQAKSLNSGGVPILSNGLKWEPLSLSSQDSQTIEAWKMTIEDISRVFRVPPMLINNLENSSFNNAEALMQFWLSSGLGFLIDHIELMLKAFFRLPDNEFIELDTEILLRTNFEGRIKALGDAVTKGIYSPNEARRKEKLPPVEGGELPRVQQQMVPLDWEQPDPEPAPAALPPPAAEGEGGETGNTEASLNMAIVLAKGYLREMRDAA